MARYKKRKQIKQAASVEILMTTLRLVWLAEMFSLTGILTSVCLPANSELGKNIEGKGDKIRQYSMIAMLRVCRAGLSACYSWVSPWVALSHVCHLQVTHSDLAALQKEFELQEYREPPRGARASAPNAAASEIR